MTALHAQAVREIEKRWNNSTSVFTEKDSGFTPSKEMFTVAQHVAHVAQDVDWFIAGAFGKRGFDMDFEAMKREILKVKSLKAARAWMKRACAKAVRVLRAKSVEEMNAPIAGPPEPGAPRNWLLAAMGDHTAHHRGALTVYARLLGRVSPVPYP